MAEKVSAKPAATELNAADYFYLVQSGQSKKISAAMLWQNASNVSIKGTCRTTDNVQSLTSPSVISLATIRSEITSDAIGGECQLPSGSDGQLKIVYMKSTSGGVYSITANLAGNASVSFERAGHSATFQYNSGEWYVIGGTANVTYN